MSVEVLMSMLAAAAAGGGCGGGGGGGGGAAGVCAWIPWFGECGGLESCWLKCSGCSTLTLMLNVSKQAHVRAKKGRLYYR